MSLRRLPYEVTSIITKSLNLEDIFHLALSCRDLQYLLYDNSLYKSFLHTQTLALPTLEAREAQRSGSYARAFRRLVKRRQAIRAVAPFTAAVVAVAESWLYHGGVLCYLQARTLRVLDLHRAARRETVVDVRGLLAAAGRPRGRRDSLQLLHCAAGLVTCLCARGRRSCLVVLDVGAQRLLTTSPPLESALKIFVRNDADFLYFGTHSEYGDDGYRRWVLMRYDIQNDQWLDQKIHLVDMVGSDTGQSVCFEIIDGMFYGLSNQTSFEVDEVDWTSYYHCFRFPVSNPRETQRSDRERMWRRQHADGPLDDRWSFLQLVQNEETGELQILESRKEWLSSSSSWQRSYYTTDLRFATNPTNFDDSSNGEDSNGEATMSGRPTTPATATTHANPMPGDRGDAGSTSSCAYAVSTPSYAASATSSRSNTPAPLLHSRRARTNFLLPATTTPRLRDPHNTHIGDNASTALLFTFSKSPVRSYHAPSQTFLDLVDDPLPGSNTARLRLRAGSRQLMALADLPPNRDGTADELLPHTERIPRLYKNGGANEIAFWPPAPERCGLYGAAALQQLEQLGRVVNPPSHTGNVAGTWDERSLVYSLGTNADGVQAVVFVCFDPAIELQGLPTWGEQQPGGEEDGPEADSPQGAQCMQDAYQHLEEQSVFEPGRDTGKGKAVAACMSDEDLAATWAPAWGMDAGTASPASTVGYSSGEDELLDADAPSSFASNARLQEWKGSNTHTHRTSSAGTGGDKWAWVEPAMYQGISFGFNHLPDFTQRRKRAAAAAAADADADAQ